MTGVLHLLVVMGIVFAVNLLPAFGPPTWAVLVFVRFRWPDVPAAALITAGALSAAAGRLLLATGTLMAAGLAGVYVAAATAAEETIDRLLPQGLTAPSTIAIQLAGVAAVVLMIKLDWIRIIDATRARIARHRGKPAPPSVRPAVGVAAEPKRRWRLRP